MSSKTWMRTVYYFQRYLKQDILARLGVGYLTFKDSSRENPGSNVTTLFLLVTSITDLSRVVTRTLAQISNCLIIVADQTSSRINKLFLK